MQSDFDFDPFQMTFQEADKDYTVCTKRETHRGIEVIEDTASPNTRSAKHSLAVLKLRWLLQAFLRKHSIGHEFQAIDFSHWAKQQPQCDDSIEFRSTGGMFVQLVNAGILEQLGYRNNGGNKDTNYHGTPRQAYRIALIDFSRLGWLEDLAGIEQNGVWDDSTPPKRAVS
ncbi:hypothetical protein COB72_03350 [bacterium]|nr:MAG: hypothetical protein COB72_03350 [bacterium]